MSLSNFHVRLLAGCLGLVMLSIACSDVDGTTDARPQSRSSSVALPNGDIPAGTYTFDFPYQSVSVELGAGWENLTQLGDTGFDLVTEGPPNWRGISVFVTRMTWYEALNFEESHRFTVGPQTEVDVGGLTGTQIDALVPDRREKPVAWLPVGASRQNDYYIDPGQKARFLFLDAPRTTITIVVEAPTSEFDAYMAQAQEVLDSMVFE